VPRLGGMTGLYLLNTSRWTYLLFFEDDGETCSEAPSTAGYRWAIWLAEYADLMNFFTKTVVHLGSSAVSGVQAYNAQTALKQPAPQEGVRIDELDWLSRASG